MKTLIWALLFSAALQSAPASHPSHDKKLVTIVSPRENKMLQSRAVDIVLEIARGADRHSLSVTLNGKDITHHLRGVKGCRGGAECLAFASVSQRAGLLSGANRLQVKAAAWTGGGDARPETFDREFFWECKRHCGGVGGTEAINLSPSVAFTTDEPGGPDAGYAWFDIYSSFLAPGGGSYPQSSDTTCTTRYQVLQLDRKQLTETSHSCYADDASLTTALKSSALTGSLVIVGTTKGQTAGAALDTSAIGGTDFSSGYAASAYPQSYMAIGVGGAAAHSTYESYSTTSVNNAGFLARLDGTLAVDASGNYSFHPHENYTYSVDATNRQITVNNYVYTAPSGFTDGFWMLKLNRNTLDNEHGCTLSSDNITYVSCGLAFATLTDAGLGSLAAALKSADPSDLIFLVSVGEPVAYLNTANAQTLADEFDALGATGYSLSNLVNVAFSTYTLISSTDPNFRKAMIGGDAVVASNLFTRQNQTGSVSGILGRDLHGMFIPSMTLQGSTAHSTATFDYSFFTSMWTPPTAWFSTTLDPGAYRYVSYQAIADANNGTADGDDIHALFPASTNDLIIKAQPLAVVYPCATTAPTCTWNDPIDGNSYTFSQSTMTEVASAMNLEVQQLAVVVQQMPIYRNIFEQSTNGSVLLVDLMQSAATMASSLGQSGASVNLNYSDLANLTGSVFSVAGVAVEGEGYGFLSGLFWGAGSAGVANVSSPHLPSPYVTLVASVSTLASDAANFTAQITTGFDVLADNIYRDPVKLQQASQNMGIGGKWQLPNQVAPDGFAAMFEQAANAYFYTQIFGSVYSIDVFAKIPTDVFALNQIGGTGSTSPTDPKPFCFPLYPKDAATNSFIINPTIGNYTPYVNDMLIMAGTIHNQGKQSMTVNVPSQAVVNMLFNPVASGGLNLNFDQFWSPSGPAPRRYYPKTPNLGIKPLFCVVTY